MSELPEPTPEPTPEPASEPEVEAALEAEQQGLNVATLKAQVDYLSQRVATLAGENARLRKERND